METSTQVSGSKTDEQKLVQFAESLLPKFRRRIESQFKGATPRGVAAYRKKAHQHLEEQLLAQHPNASNFAEVLARASEDLDGMMDVYDPGSTTD